jgi:Protein of unknown function (DUF5656)
VVEHRHLPDADKLSILSAIILLAYVIARFVDVPLNEFTIQLPGLYLNFEISFRTVISLLVAGLAASGAEWLMRQHPRLRDQKTFEHWILPAITAWVIGVPLFQLPLGFQWWLWFILGGSLLILVVVGEYITIDPDDIRQPVATAGLTAVAFSIFLILAIALRDVGFRLFWIVPALAFVGGTIALRTLHLRLHGLWAWFHAMIIALVLSQAAAALYYLPASPVTFGLILLGVVYGLTGMVANLAEGRSVRRAVIEPAIILSIVIVAALWLN